jgi:hypothetical protein
MPGSLKDSPWDTQEGWSLTYITYLQRWLQKPKCVTISSMLSQSCRADNLITISVLCGMQGGGVFCSPESEAAPAKLRLVYECAPLAFIVEVQAGVPFCPFSRTNPVLHDIAATYDILVKSCPPAQDLTWLSAALPTTQSAGGSSFDGQGSLLDQEIKSTSKKSIVCLGSRYLVQQSIPVLKAKWWYPEV